MATKTKTRTRFAVKPTPVVIEQPKKKKELALPKISLDVVLQQFIKRMNKQPIKVMKSTENDQFSRNPRINKIEVRFEDVRYSQVVKAMQGLDVSKPVTTMKDLSYSHIAQWSHESQVIKFKVSMYRYKDNSCIFIFTPTY